MTVAYATADRTATAPADYAAAFGTMTIPAGTTSASLSVATTGDATDEPDETFAVVLSNASGATLARPIANGRIVDDDGGPLQPVRDVNGDGWADLVWRHAVTGHLVLWYLQGVTQLSWTLTDPPQQADLDWEIRAVGDFNGDWRPDLLWQHRSTGSLVVWGLNQHVLTSAIWVSTLDGTSSEPDLAWKVVAAADMDRDGQDDLVWRRAGTGELRIWHMSGTFQMDSTPLTSGVGGEPWQVVGAGDLNGDGWADLVWRHDTTGGLSAWLLQDAQVLAGAPLYPPSQPDVSWRIVGVADMNRDGQPDLVWQHTDGPLVAWFMNGLTITTAEWFVPSSAGAPEWRVQGVR